jgi:hypothetical protein
MTQLKILFLFLTLCFTNKLLAQKTEKEKIIKTIAPRLGIGTQNGMNIEVGLSALAITNIPLQWGSASIYSTYFIQQKDFNSSLNIDGFKFGLQTSWAIFMCGFELKTGNYNDHGFTYLSPKIGLSWLDVINLEYLVNVAGKNDNFPWQSNHQIGINFSLNKKIYNNIWKK